MNRETLPKNKLSTLYIFIFAYLLIALCSKSSFLYPINDWTDANAYFTVGKALLHNKILYRDIFEQKGPYLYFLHTGAYLLSNRTFIGVYFFEGFACGITLLYLKKTLNLFLCPYPVLLSFLYGSIIYSSIFFYAGDSAEEFALPLLMYALYIGTGTLCSDKGLPSPREWMLIGVTSGILLWIKYTICCFYIGWICVFLSETCKRKNFRLLLHRILFLLTGILLGSLPVLIYFLWNHSLKDLINVYFIYNITEYGGGYLISRSVSSFLLKILVLAVKDPLIFILLLLPFHIKEKKIRGFYLSIFSMLAISELLMGLWTYVFLPLSLMCIFSALIFRDILSRLPVPRLFRPILPILFLIFAFYRCENTYFMNYDRKMLPQFVFAGEINKYEDTSLLSYGYMEPGIFTAAGIIPSEKHFICTNFNKKGLAEQKKYVSGQRTHFIITTDLSLEAPGYQCICTMSYYTDQKNHTFRLYKREKNILPESPPSSF